MGTRGDSSDDWKIRKIDHDLNKQLVQDFRGERSGYFKVSTSDYEPKFIGMASVCLSDASLLNHAILPVLTGYISRGPSTPLYPLQMLNLNLVGDKGYFFPNKFAEHLLRYKNFEPRRDDTWVISFPRSGTTWTQEMVWLVCNNLDYEAARRTHLTERFPFLEYYACVNDELESELLDESPNDLDRQQMIKMVCRCAVEDLNKMTSPRFIKTHLPFSLLPDNLLECGAKVIYVARNPKDVAVSYYHFHRLLKTLDFKGDFPKFWDYFERDLILWTPYWEHVAEGWALRDHPNVKFIFYEDLKRDITRGIRDMSTFLGRELTDDGVNALSRHLDIKNFRENLAVNMEVLKDLGMMNDYSHRHIRKGANGNWKEVSDGELDERADKWISENVKRFGIKFPLSY